MAQTELTDPTLQTRHLKPVLQLACLSPAATSHTLLPSLRGASFRSSWVSHASCL